ncbi:MAG: Gfo/Idh/MocA family oxidoreductase [Planctomycetota bacterium]
MAHSIPKTNRRQFVATSASLAAVPYFFSNSTSAAEAKDRPNIASIGTSIYTNRYTGDGNHPGRGAVVGHQAAQFGNMVAVADVNRKNAEFFAERYNGNCQIYKDYEEVLARDDIDAVTIGTPDHWHAKIAIDALRAGKHVYCEKPLTLTIEEGRQICKVASETDRVFQVGTQQRSEYQQIFLKAIAIAQSGMLGDKLHCLISVGTAEKGGPFENSKAPEHIDWNKWLGQTPDVPYCTQRGDYDYRWWLEYSGGQVTDWGAHHGDIALLALGLGNSGPTKISGRGDFPELKNGFNVAHTFDVDFEFPGGHTAKLLSGKNELIIGGERGRIRVNRGGLTGKPAEELGVALSGTNDWNLAESSNEEREKRKGPPWLQEAVDKLCHGKKPGNHMGNFFDCIREGGTPISDVYSSHRSASLCHLANVAMLVEEPLRYDPVKEQFVNNETANGMLSREQRDGFKIDVEV